MADDIGPVARLFAQEVPEIRTGRIEIKAIARKPGYRSKLALQSHDPGVDCIGACVGIRSHRIKNIVDALGGERIDLIRHFLRMAVLSPVGGGHSVWLCVCARTSAMQSIKSFAS